MLPSAMLEEVHLVRELTPLIFCGALGFYGFLALLLISYSRKQIVRLFTPPTPITQTQIKSLDALRGIAALGIACFHIVMWLRPFFNSISDFAPIIKTGYKFVPFFATLSGFLIYRSIRNFSSLDDLRYYVRRRILRIYPLYCVSVLTYFAFADIRPAPHSWFQRILPEVLMMPVFGYSTYLNPSNWSLFAEELFYMWVPLWVLCTRKVPLLAAYIGFAVFSLIGSAVADPVSIVKYFFVGIILCELLETKEIKNLKQIWAGCILLFGFVLIYIEYAHGDLFGNFVEVIGQKYKLNLIFDQPHNPMNPYPYYYSITLGIAVGLIILGIIKLKAATSVLGAFPLRFLGTISYSLFMWNGLIILTGTNMFLSSQMPMLQFPSTTYPPTMTAFPPSLRGTWLSFFFMYIPALLFFSSISYLLIERPFLLLRKKFKR